MRMLIAVVLWAALIPAGAIATQSDLPALTAALSASAADAQPSPDKDLNVDIDVNRGGGGAWYTSPVWLAIGALALLLLIVLLAVALRGGGGTTVIRD
jgi:hypothetical protein